MHCLKPRIFLATAVLGAAGCPPPRADLGDYTETETDDGDGDHGATTGAHTDGGPVSEGGPDDTTTATAEPSGPGGDPGTGGETSGRPTTGDPEHTTGESETTGSGPPNGVCGDGQRGPSEACDDANGVLDDGCLPDCTLGPGGELRTLDLPPIGDELMTAFTHVSAPFTGKTLHSLVIGGQLPMFGPAGQWGAHVWHVEFPQGQPSKWSYAKHAGMYGRLAHRVATAANGDVIVAGQVSTEQVDPGSGGYLWLARLTTVGAVAWSHESPLLNVAAADLVIAPEGNIVLSGSCTGVCAGSMVLVFDPEGALLWKDEALQGPAQATTYAGAAVDAAGKVYVAGTRSGPGFHHLIVRSFAAEGGLLWEEQAASPLAPVFQPSDLVLTGDDVLVVAMAQFDEQKAPLDALGLAAFDTTGQSLWWKSWTASKPGAAQPHRLVAVDDGGVYVAGGMAMGGEPIATLVARFDAEGEKVWANVVEGGDPGLDALLGVDDLLYVLMPHEIGAFLP